MATEGYDPYLKLAQLFFSKPDPAPDEMSEIRQIIWDVCQKQAQSTEASLLGIFMKTMSEHQGLQHYLLGIHDADLADGLLECVNPYTYQPSNPYTDPDYVGAGTVYDHFKGGVYLVRGLSSWASGIGERVVEYTSLLFGSNHVRLLTQWCEVVKWPDGKYRSRFVRRSDRLVQPPFKVPSPTAPPK